MRNGTPASFREEVKNSHGLRRPRVGDTLVLVVYDVSGSLVLDAPRYLVAAVSAYFLGM